jgi:SinI restriction endonuclease
LQIKNRDNSENSSSSAIRNGTPIQKWFRSFSKKAKTNWNNLPPSMQPYKLTEDGFRNFVSEYLKKEKLRLQR